MRNKLVLAIAIMVVALSVVIGLTLLAQQQDRYTLKVPDGRAFSEFQHSVVMARTHIRKHHTKAKE